MLRLTRHRHARGGSPNRSGNRTLTIATRSIAVFLVAALAAACAGGGPTASSGPSEDASGGGDVVVYGALSMKDLFEGPIGTRMAEQGVSVTQVPLLTAEALTKSIAERKNPKASVVIVDSAAYVTGVNAGLWDTIDDESVPNADSLSQEIGLDAFDHQGVPIHALTFVLMYRKDLLAEKDIPAPTSLSDLTDPRLKGHVGLVSPSSTVGIYTLLAMANANDGDAKNIDPGFEAVEQLTQSGQVGYFAGSSSDMNQAMERGDAWVAVQADAGAVRFARENDAIGFAYPSEGVPIDFNVAVIPKNAPNKAGAHKLLNELIGPETQHEFSNEIFQVPVQEDAEGQNRVLGEQEKEAGRVSFQQLNSTSGVGAWVLDWTAVAAQRNDWYTRWMSSVQSG